MLLGQAVIAAIIVVGWNSTALAKPTGPWKFRFASQHDAAEGFLSVAAADRYTSERGYGFEGDGEHFFSVAVPEGNYRVTITTGSAVQPTVTTVRAELRRLVLEAVRTAPGTLRVSVFTVNVRRPDIVVGGEVRLKDRERTSEWRSWDDRLTFEFGGPNPAVSGVEIEPVRDLPVLFIIGDSTVCDQPAEPYASWGQMLTRFFKPTIVLANHAESGESLRTALAARRFDKIFSQMRPGDYLMMQFGHNDMKAVDEANYADSIRQVVAACREKGGAPIVVSPMERRNFDENGKIRESLRGFPQAARKTAEELDVPFIDLHSMSVTLYEAIGPEKAPQAFALAGGQRDPTHHDNYGAYELAKCIVEGIRQVKPDLAQQLVDDLPKFDPARPDSIEDFSLPPSREYTGRAPDGN